MVTNTLTLVNHASVLIKGKKQSILTDPWYDGEAFRIVSVAGSWNRPNRAFVIVGLAVSAMTRR